MGYRRINYAAGIYRDANSGQEVEGVPVLAREKPRTRGDWARVDLRALDALAVDPEIQRLDWRVLACLIAHAEFENEVQVSQMYLARHLGSYSATISRSIKKLIEKGLIERHEKIGSTWTYRLNHQLVWKGNFHKLRQIQDQEAED